MSAPNNNSNPPNVARLIIQQPALPKYRVPVFRELARRPGVQLKVIHGNAVAGLSNVAADGFESQEVPERQFKLANRTLYWHAPQWSIASRAHADVVVYTWSLNYASLIPSLLKAKANGVPTMLWGHGYSKKEVAWREWPRRQVTRLATALLFYNHTTAKRYIEKGVPAEKVFVALNCLDQAPIQTERQYWLSRPLELRAFQNEHGLHQKPVILFVSRLEHDNRVDLLLHATHALRTEFADLQVVIVGKGPDESRLRAIAHDLNLANQVTFAGPIYVERELAPWFLSARVFCYPANIGLSLLHAFGYALPVITSDRVESQNPEIEALEHEHNGLLYRHNDIDALASAIRRVIVDREFALALSEQAHRTATERFSLSNMVDGFEAGVRYCLRQHS